MQCPKCKIGFLTDVLDDQEYKIATATAECPNFHLTLNVIWPHGPKNEAILIPDKINIFAV
jgi:hypothetical protein